MATRPMNSADWDYIIVGAGSAGCVLANRLTQDGHFRVLLVEGGGEDYSPYIRVPAWSRSTRSTTGATPPTPTPPATA